MLIQASRDIQPLCDQCHRAMVATRFGASDYEFAAHVCENVDCQQRVFRIDRGYFNIVGGRPLADKTGMIACPACDHGVNMFLASINPDTLEEFWKCPQDGCGFQQRMTK